MNGMTDNRLSADQRGILIALAILWGGVMAATAIAQFDLLLHTYVYHCGKDPAGD